MRALVVFFSLFAFAAPAMAKPSDWADVIEKPGEKAALPSARENAPQVVTAAKSAKPAKKERATKKAKKTKKAPRRGKSKHARR